MLGCGFCNSCNSKCCNVQNCSHLRARWRDWESGKGVRWQDQEEITESRDPCIGPGSANDKSNVWQGRWAGEAKVTGSPLFQVRLSCCPVLLTCCRLLDPVVCWLPPLCYGSSNGSSCSVEAINYCCLSCLKKVNSPVPCLWSKQHDLSDFILTAVLCLYARICINMNIYTKV